MINLEFETMMLVKMVPIVIVNKFIVILSELCAKKKLLYCIACTQDSENQPVSWCCHIAKEANLTAKDYSLAGNTELGCCSDDTERPEMDEEEANPCSSGSAIIALQIESLLNYFISFDMKIEWSFGERKTLRMVKEYQKPV